jgi:hypothetical protein
MANPVEISSDQLSIEQQLLSIRLKSLKTVEDAAAAMTLTNDIADMATKNAMKKQGVEQKILLYQITIQKNLQQIAIIESQISAGIIKRFIVAGRLKELENEMFTAVSARADLENQIKDSSHEHFLNIIKTIPMVDRLLSFTSQLMTYWKSHKGLAVLQVGLIAVLYTVKNILDKFLEMDKAATAFRKQMGITVDENKELEERAREIAFQYQAMGVSGENVYNSFKAVAETVGTTQAATNDLVKDMALMSAQLGISEKLSAEFLKSMGMVSRSTLDSQRYMLFFTQNMAQAGGVKLDDVMNDIASASKSSYQFLSRDPLVLAKAAVEARRMGTSLESAATSSRSLVDFTSNVRAEMEASVLLGKALNVQKARELSYYRNIEGLNQEILRLAKDVNFNQLDLFQQEAFAKVFGKQSGEIASMLQADKERQAIASSMTPEIITARKEYERMKKANDEIAKATSINVENMVATKTNQEAIRSISLAWHSIIQKLAQDVLPPVAAAFRGIANALALSPAWLSKLSVGLIAIGTIATGVGLIITNKIINVLINKLFGGVAGKGFTSLLSGIGNGLSAIGTNFAAAMKGIAVIAALAGAMVIFALAFKLVKDVKTEVFENMLASVALLGLMAGIFSIAAAPLALGAGVIALLGLALIPFSVAALGAGLAMKMLGQGFESIVGGFERLGKISFFSLTFQVISLTSAITALSAALATLPDMDVDKLEKIGSIKIGGTKDTGIAAVPDIGTDNSRLILQELKDLRSDLKNGGIAATVRVGATELKTTLARESNRESSLPGVRASTGGG